MADTNLLPAFDEIVELIKRSRQNALRAVNTSLIELYWQVGAYISNKLATAAWGEGVVDQLAAHLARTQPGLRGFTRPNLFRMRQFFEAYSDEEKVSPLVRQLPWTHNLIILSRCKRSDEREFYIRFTIRERWSKRELERQCKSALFERRAYSIHPRRQRRLHNTIRRLFSLSRTPIWSNFSTSLKGTARAIFSKDWLLGSRIFSSSSDGTSAMWAQNIPFK